MMYGKINGAAFGYLEGFTISFIQKEICIWGRSWTHLCKFFVTYCFLFELNIGQFKHKCCQVLKLPVSVPSSPALPSPHAPNLSTPPLHLHVWNSHYILSPGGPAVHKSNLSIFTTHKFNRSGFSPTAFPFMEQITASPQTDNSFKT